MIWNSWTHVESSSTFLFVRWNTNLEFFHENECVYFQTAKNVINNLFVRSKNETTNWHFRLKIDLEHIKTNFVGKKISICRFRIGCCIWWTRLVYKFIRRFHHFFQQFFPVRADEKENKHLISSKQFFFSVCQLQKKS